MKHQTVLPPRRVNISEIFRSIQGEGSRTGLPSVFVRFSGCNLRCRWRGEDGRESICDTPYTSYRPERNLMAMEDVHTRVGSLLRSRDDLVITGGEPMLYPTAVEALVQAHGQRRLVTIETNGTKALNVRSENLLYSVSPKLRNSASTVDPLLVLEHVNAIRQASVQLKFVCAGPRDLDEVDEFCSRVKVPAQVFLMPLGSSSQDVEERLRLLIPLAQRRGFLVTDRVHIHLWPGERGV